MHLVFHFARLLLHQRTYVISMAIASVWEHFTFECVCTWRCFEQLANRVRTFVNAKPSNIEVHLYLLQFKYNSKAVDFSAYSLLCFFKIHVRIGSSNKPVLSNEGKVSCLRKQITALIGFVHTIDKLRVRRATRCITPPVFHCLMFHLFVYVSLSLYFLYFQQSR